MYSRAGRSCLERRPGCHGGRAPARFAGRFRFLSSVVRLDRSIRQDLAPPRTREVRMTARGSLAIAALAFQATLLPLPALAQTDYVPSAAGPGPTSGPLISRQTAALAGLLFAGALLGDRQFREESQEHRDATSNSVASVGNTFGDYKVLIPVIVGRLPRRADRRQPRDQGDRPPGRRRGGARHRHHHRAQVLLRAQSARCRGHQHRVPAVQRLRLVPVGSHRRRLRPGHGHRRPDPRRLVRLRALWCRHRSPRSPGSTTIVTGRPMS